VADAHAIRVPTVDELGRAAEDFDRDWGAVDEVLYGICRQYPDHSDRRGLTAKVALINRAYQAGLERRVTPPVGSQAITVIADYMFEQRREIDAIVGQLGAMCEPQTAADMRRIVGLHGLLTGVLVGVTTDGKAPRSFAAKYLHFHNPAVPIFDSYAAIALGKLVRWDGARVPFTCPEHGDLEYYDFCVRFWRLYAACRSKGVEVTVKTLDHYLWTVPARAPLATPPA
jgi:hypothetical protein